MSQELAKGKPDRFTVQFDPPIDGLRLYRLEVLLYHDRGTRPKRLGEVLLSLPKVRIPGYLRGSASRSCTQDNMSRLRDILTPNIEAPSQLANLLAAG